MEEFKKLRGIVASLPQVNIDTDAIIPKQFLKTINRTGLGQYLFYDKRYDKDNNLNEDFVLNKDPWKKSSVIVAGDNFGCGSSREHAPWALLDFGIKSVISTSFADIFYNNCFKNGILPIIVDEVIRDEISILASEGAEISINLEDQSIIIHNKVFNFEIDPYRKEYLLKGLDDIGITLENEDSIYNYEQEFNKNLWNVPNKIK
tara:strand:- start:193 stop:804 length:612 start_codon:yes stop_codon:yes gene_type:complete